MISKGGKSVAAAMAAEFQMRSNPALIGFRVPQEPWAVIANYAPTRESPAS